MNSCDFVTIWWSPFSMYLHGAGAIVSNVKILDISSGKSAKYRLLTTKTFKPVNSNSLSIPASDVLYSNESRMSMENTAYLKFTPLDMCASSLGRETQKKSSMTHSVQ